MRRLLIATAAAGILAGPALAQTPPIPPVPVTGPVIANGSWDGKIQKSRGGLPAGWLGLQVKPARTTCFALSCSRYALKLVKVPVRDGTRAARFTVKDGDNPFGDAERAEVQGAITGRAGTIRWYTWSTYLPPGFRYAPADDDHWLAFTQFAVGKGSPPVQMTVHEGQIVLQVNEQASPARFLDVHRVWGTPIVPHLGRWTDFALFVKWTSAGDGQVQLWVDGVQQQMNWPFGAEAAPRYGGLGSYAVVGPTLVPGGGPSFVRQGIVRAKAYGGTTTLVNDALRVYAAAAVPPPPAAPVPAPPIAVPPA